MNGLLKMLDEYEELYAQEKTNLFPNLVQHNNFNERKRVLDEFFDKLDRKTQEIKNSQAYTAFKKSLIMDSSSPNKQ